MCYKINPMKNKKGFTLIELLVVISIIALLSSIVLASLSSARSKARDAQRLMNSKQLRNALELYYNDNNQYPCVAPCAGGSGCPISSLSTFLSPKYIPLLSDDPQSPTYNDQYACTHNGGDPAYGGGYALFLHFEDAVKFNTTNPTHNGYCLSGTDYLGWWGLTNACTNVGS